MKPLTVKLLREIGLDTPNAEAVVTFKLMAYAPDFVHAVAEELRAREREGDDPRQGWLALPEYQHIPVEAARDSLEDLRARIAKAKRRLDSYNYRRCSPETATALQESIEEMERLEKRITRYFAGDPNQDVNGAMLELQRRRQTAAAKRNRKGGKARQTAHRKSIT